MRAPKKTFVEQFKILLSRMCEHNLKVDDAINDIFLHNTFKTLEDVENLEAVESMLMRYRAKLDVQIKEFARLKRRVPAYTKSYLNPENHRKQAQ